MDAPQANQLLPKAFSVHMHGGLCHHSSLIPRPAAAGAQAGSRLAAAAQQEDPNLDPASLGSQQQGVTKAAELQAAADTPNINVLADPVERVDKPLPGVTGEGGTSR